MINGDLKEFLDKLYCGEELLFEYKGVDYFLQGWVEDDKARMVLDCNSDKTFHGYIWESVKKTMRECAEEFLQVQMWDEKSFSDIQSIVIWKE